MNDYLPLEQLAEIQGIARRILESNPEPVPRYRLMRDVLSLPPEDKELQNARKDLEHCPQVQQLLHEQYDDGSWGPFHSRDSQQKKAIPCTEAGVERALALGLDADHPALQKTRAYIISILEGKRHFPDRPEKNSRWSTGVRLFLAATLILLQPYHPCLTHQRALWVEICKRTFASGIYSEDAEIRAHLELTGAAVQDSYLVINGKYQLAILGSIPGTLPVETETALLRWLWRRPLGIGYFSVPLKPPPPGAKLAGIDRWLASHELLARGFPSWRAIAREAFDWLWHQRNEKGGWDFGSRPADNIRLPYSKEWRNPHARFIDWTTRVLALLRSIYT